MKNNPECIECGLLKSTTESLVSPLCSRAKLAGGSHNFPSYCKDSVPLYDKMTKNADENEKLGNEIIDRTIRSAHEAECECKCEECFEGKHCANIKCGPGPLDRINPASTVIELKEKESRLWCDGGIDCRCICHQKDYEPPKDMGKLGTILVKGDSTDGSIEPDLLTTKNKSISNKLAECQCHCHLPTQHTCLSTTCLHLLWCSCTPQHPDLQSKQMAVEPQEENAIGFKGEQNRKWYMKGFDEGRSSIKEDLAYVEPATGHAAKFNFKDEWYAGYNCAIDTIIKLLK